MMMAAMEGALAFQKGMGAVHALSHPLGVLHLHHGTLNAVLIPPVLRYNADHLKDKMATLRTVLNLQPGQDVADWFADLNMRLNMPANLKAMKVPAERFDEFAAEAMTDSSHPSNPRPMTQADYKAILETAF